MPDGEPLADVPERSGKGKQIKEGYSYDTDKYADTPPPSEWDEAPPSSAETDSQEAD